MIGCFFEIVIQVFFFWNAPHVSFPDLERDLTYLYVYSICLIKVPVAYHGGGL